MKMNKMMKYLCLMLLCASLCGCIAEDMGDCPPDTAVFGVTVRAFHNSGAQLDSTVVDDVRVFVYDEELCFLKSVEARLDSSTFIEVPGGMDVHLVAWGNLDGDTHQFKEPQAGEHLSLHCVDLMDNSRTRAQAMDMLSPGDLFRGELKVMEEEQENLHTISLSREVGSMTVTVRGAKEKFGFDDDDYWVDILGVTQSIDFSGDQTGTDPISYNPEGAFATQDYFVPAFNLLPATEITIELYHGTELLDTVRRDAAEQSINVVQGQQTNVLIEYDNSVRLDVRLSITDWGKNELWSKF